MHSFSPEYVLVRPLEATGDHQGPGLGRNSPPTVCHGDLEESFGISDDSLFQRNVQDNDAGRPNNWSSNNPTSEDSSTMKKRKLSHNAYERDRRKKTNALYSSLRSLLPETDRLHKRLSIPSTVSRVLQYIPELQRQVERLKRRKEEIKKSKLIPKAEDKTLPTDAVEGVRPAISVSVLGVREMGIQIICSCGKGSRGRRESRLSDILDYLEGKGLGLVRASSLAMGDDRALHNLHLQVKNGFSDVMDPGRVSKNLRSILS